MLRRAKIHNVAGQMLKKATVPFFTNANDAQHFFNRIFSKKWGQALCACVGPPDPPPFLGKNSTKKVVVHRLRL